MPKAQNNAVTALQMQRQCSFKRVEDAGTDSCTPLTGSAATLQSAWQLRYVLQPLCLPVPIL
jgi:hypothetical protein